MALECPLPRKITVPKTGLSSILLTPSHITFWLPMDQEYIFIIVDIPPLFSSRIGGWRAWKSSVIFSNGKNVVMKYIFLENRDILFFYYTKLQICRCILHIFPDSGENEKIDPWFWWRSEVILVSVAKKIYLKPRLRDEFCYFLTTISRLSGDQQKIKNFTCRFSSGIWQWEL